MAATVATVKEKAAGAEFKVISLRDITANQAQSRGMGVLSKLQSVGYGVFDKLKGHEDKDPVWWMLLSEDKNVKTSAVKLIESGEPSLASLAGGLRSMGQMEPIGVRVMGDGKLDVIFGMRRALATAFNVAKHGDPDSIEAKVFTTKKSTVDLLLMALTENDDREDESPVDKALTFKRLKDEAKLTNKDIAERTRQTSQNVGNYLRLLSPKIEDLRGKVHSGECSIARALKILDKREGKANASDQTPAEGRYRLPGTKALVRIYTAPSKPRKMEDAEWELWKDPGVRKLLAFKLGLEFKEWEPGPGFNAETGADGPAATNGDGDPGDHKPAQKVIKIGRGLANKLLVGLGKTSAATWEDKLVEEKLTDIVNIVEDGQKMETAALQKVLDKLVANYADGGRVEVTADKKK